MPQVPHVPNASTLTRAGVQLDAANPEFLSLLLLQLLRTVCLRPFGLADLCSLGPAPSLPLFACFPQLILDECLLGHHVLCDVRLPLASRRFCVRNYCEHIRVPLPV